MQQFHFEFARSITLAITVSLALVSGVAGFVWWLWRHRG